MNWLTKPMAISMSQLAMILMAWRSLELFGVKLFKWTRAAIARCHQCGKRIGLVAFTKGVAGRVRVAADDGDGERVAFWHLRHFSAAEQARFIGGLTVLDVPDAVITAHPPVRVRDEGDPE